MILVWILVITLGILFFQMWNNKYKKKKTPDYSHLKTIEEGDTILIEDNNDLEYAYVVINNVAEEYLVVIVDTGGLSKNITIYYDDPQLKHFKYYN